MVVKHRQDLVGVPARLPEVLENGPQAACEYNPVVGRSIEDGSGYSQGYLGGRNALALSSHVPAWISGFLLAASQGHWGSPPPRAPSQGHQGSPHPPHRHPPRGTRAVPAHPTGLFSCCFDRRPHNCVSKHSPPLFVSLCCRLEAEVSVFLGLAFEACSY